MLVEVVVVDGQEIDIIHALCKRPSSLLHSPQRLQAELQAQKQLRRRRGRGRTSPLPRQHGRPEYGIYRR